MVPAALGLCKKPGWHSFTGESSCKRRHVHRKPGDKRKSGLQVLTQSLTGSGALGPSTFIFKMTVLNDL